MSAQEMLALGEKLSRGLWTQDQNRSMMRSMGVHSPSGKVSMSSFVNYFNDFLPADTVQFEKVIDEFMSTASNLKEIKTSLRVVALQRVYKEFDINCDGTVSSREMLALGQARRDLGQKGGEWTKEHNRRMMRAMKADQHDCVSMKNFVKYFNSELPHDPTEFERTIAEFLKCARAIRHRKEPVYPPPPPSQVVVQHNDNDRLKAVWK